MGALDGQVAIVTGASAGVGRATALAGAGGAAGRTAACTALPRPPATPCAAGRDPDPPAPTPPGPPAVAGARSRDVDRPRAAPGAAHAGAGPRRGAGREGPTGPRLRPPRHERRAPLVLLRAHRPWRPVGRGRPMPRLAGRRRPGLRPGADGLSAAPDRARDATGRHRGAAPPRAALRDLGLRGRITPPSSSA